MLLDGAATPSREQRLSICVQHNNTRNGLFAGTVKQAHSFDR